MYVPVFDEENRIEALSIHLDKPFNDTTDLWFSSRDKINGTGVKNFVGKTEIDDNQEILVLTDSILLGNLIRDMLDAPVISFQGISNSYQILKVIENTNISRIIFTVRIPESQNLNYIIHRVYKDLIPLGYDIESKVVKDYTDVLDENFLSAYRLEKVA